MNEIIKIVTEETLQKTNLKYYVGGRELKVGDKVIFACTIGYSNLTGNSPSSFNKHDETVGLNLKMFVWDERASMFFELYSLKQ
jgi:hypothetical protein